MKKNNGLKVLALLCAVMMMITTLGCKKDGGTSKETSTPVSTAEATTTPEAIATPSATQVDATPQATATPEAIATPDAGTVTATPAAATQTVATVTPKPTAAGAKATSTPKAAATPKPSGSTTTPTVSANLTNVALEKIGITTNNIDGAKGREYRLTDGSRFDSTQWLGIGSGPRWIQLDLEKSYSIEKIHLWKFFGDDRTYHDEIIQFSNDPEFKTGVVTVFNNDTDNSSGQGIGKDAEYPQSADGKEFIFKAVNARYVRIWANGSTGNTINHFTELEVYGK